MIDINGDEKAVATEQETLDFANRLRSAGAADTLDALMPSTPEDVDSCLIANACNFKCAVFGAPNDGERWAMHFPKNTPHARIRALAAAVGCEVEEVLDSLDLESYSRLALVLPEAIGNVAAAFDYGAGWPAKYIAAVDQ